MIKVNGIDVNVAGNSSAEISYEGMSLAQYLSSTNYDCKRIAVEKNGCIVPKSKYEETILKDGDALEIVSFVGGG